MHGALPACVSIVSPSVTEVVEIHTRMALLWVPKVSAPVSFYTLRTFTLVSQPASKSVSQSASQRVSQSASQPESQSVSQLVSQSVSQPVNGVCGQSIHGYKGSAGIRGWLVQ